MRAAIKKRGALVLCLAVSLSLALSIPASGGLQAREMEQETDPSHPVYLPLIEGGEEQTEVSIEEEVGSAEISAPSEIEEMAWLNEEPVLSADEQAQIEYWQNHIHLPGPSAEPEEQTPLADIALDSDSASSVSEDSITLNLPDSIEDEVIAQAIDDQLAPAAPGSRVIFRKVSSITAIGSKSNILEGSVGQRGRYAFYAGNWFAARSTNGGSTWSYASPYSGMADFCCDQVALYDSSRDLILWYRQGARNSTGSNRFRLGVSTNGGQSFCYYDIRPTNANSGWTNQWWDYPHLQLGADYLYIATNVFNNASPPQWRRTVMLRFPLDSLRLCVGFSFNYYWSTYWFTFVPVQGADHIMYWASNWPSGNPQNSRIAIYRWPENGASVSAVVRTLTAWTYTNGRRSSTRAVCGSTSGNWAGRTDQRILSGARYTIQASNLQIKGRKIIGWWWNVKQGGNFARPYIEAAAFYEDTLTQVAGNRGRPLVWNSSTCYLYPSVAANDRGDLGMVLNYGGSGIGYRPSVAYGIADDYQSAPPGWWLSAVQNSNARPSDNVWGDYNTTRPFYPTGEVWIGAAHWIANTTNCQRCSRPLYFVFGRDRDRYGWLQWQNK